MRRFLDLSAFLTCFLVFEHFVYWWQQDILKVGGDESGSKGDDRGYQSRRGSVGECVRCCSFTMLLLSLFNVSHQSVVFEILLLTVSLSTPCLSARPLLSFLGLFSVAFNVLLAHGVPIPLSSLRITRLCSTKGEDQQGYRCLSGCAAETEPGKEGDC